MGKSPQMRKNYKKYSGKSSASKALKCNALSSYKSGVQYGESVFSVKNLGLNN
jgi:hypothetical protein